MILALDPSRYTGWCAGVPGSKPKFGLWDVSALRAGGPRFGGYCDLLADAITIHAPFLVVTEVDVSLHRQNPDATARQQIGMACLTELICWRRGVEYREATAGDARKAVLGSAMFGAGGEAKRAVLKMVALLGYPVEDHNIADSIVLWLYAERIWGRRRAA